MTRAAAARHECWRTRADALRDRINARLGGIAWTAHLLDDPAVTPFRPWWPSTAREAELLATYDRLCERLADDGRD